MEAVNEIEGQRHQYDSAHQDQRQVHARYSG
jgi:hypothetical protein